MSLLLEALKKAEKAKEEAQRRDGGAPSLQLAEEAAPAAPARPVMTRAELPDITAPLEILSEDLGARPAPREQRESREPRELSLQGAPPAAPSGPAAAPRRATAAPAETQAADRAAARKVFEAKVREPNPRLPFFITMGLLGAAAVGIFIYFWIQLRPPAPLVNASPQQSASEATAAAAPAAAATAQPQSAIQGLPPVSAPAAKPPAAEARPAGPAARSATPAIPRDAPPPRIAPAARPAPERTPETPVLAPTRRPAQVDERVAAAYAAFQAGNLDAARNGYQQALRDEPTNRDALLGLAAVETRARRYDLAEANYARLLQADPRDPYAQAGMLALRGEGADPVLVESRLKTLLAGDPESGVLHFALGNLYARQARWADAQQGYFKAMAADPENPDYAYNLAVSLEHLHQSGPALDYYRRALALAEKRSAAFDAATVRIRLQQLAR